MKKKVKQEVSLNILDKIKETGEKTERKNI